MKDSIRNALQAAQATPDMQQRFEQLRQRPSLLEVKGLHKYFQTNNGALLALKDINISVKRRELVCVIGASGCGKSTLSRIIAGLEPYDSGEVLLDGQPVTDVGADRGMVFQGYTLFPWRTVKQNVMFGPQMRGQNTIEAERAALQWLELIGLQKFADHYPHQLSGGMKQRVAIIARALVNEPRMLLMDEPFGALDPHTRQKMQQHLLEIWRNIDITIVFVTHDMDEAILLADRIIVLKPHPGQLQEIIDVPLPRPRHPEMLSEPTFRVIKDYLNALIHGDEESHEVDPDLELIPQIPRMTRVDDNVE